MPAKRFSKNCSSVRQDTAHPSGNITVVSEQGTSKNGNRTVERSENKLEVLRQTETRAVLPKCGETAKHAE